MRRKKQRGSVMLEFVFAGISAVTMLISTIQFCIGMWNYHTLAYSVHEASRYVASHGRGCVTGSNACSITVGDIAARIMSNSIGIPASTLNVTLKTDSGATTLCNPVTSCANNATAWPPTSNLDNFTGKRITVSASFTFKPALALSWPGVQPPRFGSFVLPASSTESIVF